MHNTTKPGGSNSCVESFPAKKSRGKNGRLRWWTFCLLGRTPVNVGLIGTFWTFWKKEACSKLGILFTFFFVFAWFCSKNHWWRTWMSLESEGLKKGSRSVDSRSSAWKEAGCPCWSCGLGRNWLCPSFSPLLQGFWANPQIQPNDSWSSGH